MDRIWFEHGPKVACEAKQFDHRPSNEEFAIDGMTNLTLFANSRLLVGQRHFVLMLASLNGDID